MGLILMTLFNWLLVGHLVGDYILQTRWMAEKKSQEFLALFVHSAVYTASVALLALLTYRTNGASGLSWWAIGLIFLAHLALDQRKFINFWARKINGNANIEWLKITLDQSWHILILALATLL
jgi:hypothetical protein